MPEAYQMTPYQVATVLSHLYKVNAEADDQTVVVSLLKADSAQNFTSALVKDGVLQNENLDKITTTALKQNRTLFIDMDVLDTGALKKAYAAKISPSVATDGDGQAYLDRLIPQVEAITLVRHDQNHSGSVLNNLFYAAAAMENSLRKEPEIADKVAEFRQEGSAFVVALKKAVFESSLTANIGPELASTLIENASGVKIKPEELQVKAAKLPQVAF